VLQHMPTLQLCAAVLQLFCSCMAQPVFDVASASPSQFYSWDNTAFFQVGQHTDLTDSDHGECSADLIKFEGYIVCRITATAFQ